MDALGLMTFPVLSIGGGCGHTAMFQLPNTYERTVDKVTTGSGVETLTIASRTITVDLSLYATNATYIVIYFNRLCWDYFVDDEQIHSNAVIPPTDDNKLFGPFVLYPGTSIKKSQSTMCLSTSSNTTIIDTYLVSFNADQYLNFTSGWALELYDSGYTAKATQLDRHFGFFGGYVFFY